jgi:hypothetical protein
MFCSRINVGTFYCGEIKMTFLLIVLNLVLLAVLMYKCKEAFKSVKIMFGLWFKTEKEIEQEREEIENARKIINDNKHKTDDGDELIFISKNDTIMLVFCCVYSALSAYSLLFGILSMAGYVYYCLEGKNYLPQT